MWLQLRSCKADNAFSGAKTATKVPLQYKLCSAAIVASGARSATPPPSTERGWLQLRLRKAASAARGVRGVRSTTKVQLQSRLRIDVNEESGDRSVMGFPLPCSPGFVMLSTLKAGPGLQPG